MASGCAAEDGHHCRDHAAVRLRSGAPSQAVTFYATVDSDAGVTMRWMYRWWAVWVGVAIVLAARSAVAHDQLMRRIGAQDGLSPQAIVALAQDERGFVWIGTSAGLLPLAGST